MFKQLFSTFKVFGVFLLVSSILCVPAAYAEGGELKSITDFEDTQITYNDESVSETEDEQVRDEHGQVSLLNTESRNPYHNLISLRIDLGAEFARFDGSEWSEGILVKCRPGDVIKLPVVRCKPGYTFVGWSQGGVPDEIEIGIDTEEVEMADNAEDGNQTVLYAVYMDDAGNGICTCGAYTKEAYVDHIDEYKEQYSYYLAKNRGKAAQDLIFREKMWMGMIIMVAGAFVLWSIVLLSTRKRNRQSEHTVDIED